MPTRLAVLAPDLLAARPPSSSATGSPRGWGARSARPICSTFHSFAYGLIRALRPARALRRAAAAALSAPEQDVVLQRAPDAASPSPSPGRTRLDRRVGTRGFAREVQTVLSRAREKGLERGDLRRARRREQAARSTSRRRPFLEQYLAVLDAQTAIDYADLIRRAVLEAPSTHRDELRRRFRHVFVDEYQDTDPAPGRAAARARAATARDLVVVGDPHQSIYGVPRRRRARHPRLPRRRSRVPTASPADVVALRTTRRFGPRILLAASAASRRGSPLPGAIDEEAREPFLTPVAAGALATRTGSRCVTYDTERAEAEHLADLLRRAHLEDGVGVVGDGRAGPVGPDHRSRRCAGPCARPASRSRSPRDDTPLVREPAVRRCSTRCAAVVNARRRRRGRRRLRRPRAGRAAAARVAARRPRRHRRPRSSPGGCGLASRTWPRRRAGTPRPSPELLREACARPRGPGGAWPARATPTAARWPWPGCCSPARDARRRRHRRGGALGALVRHRLARPAPRRGVGVAGSPPGSPTATSTRSSPCSTPRRGPRSSAAHTRRRDFLRHARRPADPGRHPRRAGGPRRRRAAAHRSPVQGPRVAAGRGRPRPGGRLARPAPSRHAAAGRPDRVGGRLVPPTTTRELLAEERRLFYVACTRARTPSGRHRGGVARRRRRAAVAVRGRARASTVRGTSRGGRARPLSLAGLVAELRRTRRRRRTPEPRSGRGRASAGPAGPRDRDGAVRSCPAPTPPPGGAPAPGRPRTSRSGPSTSRCAVSASALDRPRPRARPSGSSSARPAPSARPAQAQGFGNVVHALADRISRGTSRRPGDPRRRRRADGARRRGLGADPVPHAVVGRS